MKHLFTNMLASHRKGVRLATLHQGENYANYKMDNVFVLMLHGLTSSCSTNYYFSFDEITSWSSLTLTL